MNKNTQKTEKKGFKKKEAYTRLGKGKKDVFVMKIKYSMIFFSN